MSKACDEACLLQKMDDGRGGERRALRNNQIQRGTRRAAERGTWKPRGRAFVSSHLETNNNTLQTLPPTTALLVIIDIDRYTLLNPATQQADPIALLRHLRNLHRSPAIS
jgi:hypothetical protein